MAKLVLEHGKFYKLEFKAFDSDSRITRWIAIIDGALKWNWKDDGKWKPVRRDNPRMSSPNRFMNWVVGQDLKILEVGNL